MWAPSADGNDVPGYIASLSKQTGFGADQALNLHDPKVLAPLLSAITKRENGQNPYDAESFSKAAASAARETQGSAPTVNLVVHNVPAGLTVKVAGSTPNNVGLSFAPGSAN